MSSLRRPESVLVVIATKGGDVLLLRRREPAGYWQSVTGSLDWGESALAAARREVFEETGLSADAGLEETGVVNEYEILPAWREKYAPEVRTNREHVFYLRLAARVDVRLDPGAHLEYCWLPAAVAAARASSSTDREAIHLLIRS